MRILAINGGSSSFKSRLDDLPTGPLSIQAPKPLWHDQFELKGSVSESLAPVLKTVPGPIDAVGHRIVDGGGKFRQVTPLTPEVRAAIAEAAEVAPAHNRFELEAIRTVEEVLGKNVPQFAVFDA